MIVCLDANIIIYYIERNPVWEPKVSARLKAIAAAGDSLAASEAALLECLVGPFQSGDSATVTDYQKFFGSPNVQMLAVTPAVWQRAAQLRATYKLKPLDSIHLASAVEHGCNLFLTNDAPLALHGDRRRDPNVTLASKIQNESAKITESVERQASGERFAWR